MKRGEEDVDFVVSANTHCSMTDVTHTPITADIKEIIIGVKFNDGHNSPLTR